MRVLLSTYGSRGDVEPIAGLATQLRALGDQPWLATDPILDPWQPTDLDVVQTGAWILPRGPRQAERCSVMATWFVTPVQTPCRMHMVASDLRSEPTT